MIYYQIYFLNFTHKFGKNYQQMTNVGPGKTSKNKIKN